jgi:DNA-directed RNA polymerase specialized sigma24 family protein
VESDLSTPAHPAKPVVVVTNADDGAGSNQGSANVEESGSKLGPELDRDYTEWIEPQFAHMERLAYFRCRDYDLATRLAQNAAVKIYLMWGDERRRAAIKEGGFGYVGKVINSAYLDFVRSCSREKLLMEKLSGAAMTALRWATGRLDLETVWTVRDAVLSLEDQQLMLIFLIYYEGLNVSEAGRELNLRVDKAHRVHNKALEKLKQILAD